MEKGLNSTIRFLESCASTATTELLGLAATGIGNEECAVVPDEDVFDLLLGLLIDVLLVVSDESLGDALTDGVNLGGVSTALDTDAHVDAGKTVAAEEEDGLEGLEAEDLRLDELDRTAVDLDEAAAALAVGDGHRRLLTAEALDLLKCGCCLRHVCN